MQKQWKHKTTPNLEAVQTIQDTLNVDATIAKLLVQRGIQTFDEARDFFRPQLEHLHDPFLMKDMHKAVERIEKAIQNGEKILVFGDYDVDGTTAVAVVFSFLKRIHPHVGYYIPDRYTDGYGVSLRGIDFAKENGFTLIISLDCGIKANSQIDYSNSLGIDFIVGDHHRPGDEIPNALAVLDPKQSDCPYPYKELSGCGVGFKLIQAYAQKNNIDEKEVFDFLDLVAVSIASDIVPLTGENRVLSYYGLKQLNEKPRPALEAILKYSNYNKSNKGKAELYFSRELTLTDLVFLIGPRINAAGRMENGKYAVRLLLSENIAEADEMGKKINDYNTERKSLDTQATKEALEEFDINDDLKNSKSTIVYNPDWHKGVIGIVASRLTEHYYRPTIVFTKSGDFLTGSARSVKDFDIYDAIEACNDLLEHWGGHKYAAGLSLKPENFAEFRERFEYIVTETLQGKELVPEIEIDEELVLQDITPKFIRILKQFAPFGPGNANPVFSSKQVKDSGQARVVGSNHIKMAVYQPEKSSFPIEAIAFHQGGHYLTINSGKKFDICYHIEENDWNGKCSLQLNVKDIKSDNC